MANPVEFPFPITNVVYIEADLKFDQDYLDNGGFPLSRTPLYVANTGSGEQGAQLFWNGSAYQWIDLALQFDPSLANTDPDVWHTIKIGWDTTNTFEVDGDTPIWYGGGHPNVQKLVLSKVSTAQVGHLYARNIKVGSALGLSDLVDAPAEIEIAPLLSDGGRVSIAFDDDWKSPDPTWTVIDNVPNLVAGIDIHRGRQTEIDVTETSTATVLLNDTTGLFDPDNEDSPYFGVIDGKQILLQGWNPVTREWVSLWRGHIDDYGYDFNPAVNADGEPLVANIAIQCVDLFEYLAGVEMLVGVFGDPAGPDGVVFYEDTDFQTRLTHLADDAQLPAEFYSFFTGNVDVQESRHDPGDSVLAAMRDCVDAEFPGIANLFTDRFGKVCAHGRFARFTPEDVASGTDWIFTRWKAGDGPAIELDPDRAQIRPPLRWGRSRSRIYNAAVAWPKFPIAPSVSVVDLGQGTYTEADMPGQITVDPTSRELYGYRSFPAMSDLITLRGTTTGNDAKDETKLFADYYVQNYKDPRTRVEALTFKSIDPDDPRAAATWGLLTAFDISDVVELQHGYPGGVGIDEDFYIEGSEMSIRPLNAEFDMVELTLNVSAAAYYPPGWWS